MKLSDKYIARFWDRVSKSDRCWEWTAGKNTEGYGYLCIQNKPYRVHRISWELAHGPIPTGLHVLHSCDNPSCVRPDHLFLGTDKDNMDDMRRKERQNFIGPTPKLGHDNPRALLTESEVIEIRQRYSAGERPHALAKAFGRAYSCISMITTNRNWRHLPLAVPPEQFNEPIVRSDYCRKGHFRTAENTAKDGSCRICKNKRQNARRARIIASIREGKSG